ncbi:Sden_1164 family protein [Streptomyces sp. NPDC012769]|uniref:Sden_1164 family protein n=1 Tax=Streptomyces sp. NPDC012769 TaxID=3364848 RepID=UPI0036931883
MTRAVVILAAGANRRMGDFTPVPKALLPLDPEEKESPTFLGRAVELFRATGADRVLVVVNASTARHFAAYAEEGVELVVAGDDGAPTGSSVSMLAGLDAVLRHHPDGADTLVTDADVVYERALLEQVVARCDASRLFTVDRVTGDGEEVRVYGAPDGTPALIGKGMGGEVSRGLELLGESLGIIHVAAADLRACAALTRWMVGDPPASPPYGYSRRLSEHEEVWQYLFGLRRLGVARLPGDLLFSECDFPEDYRQVVEVLYPAIRQRDTVASPAG